MTEAIERKGRGSTRSEHDNRLGPSEDAAPPVQQLRLHFVVLLLDAACFLRFYTMAFRFVLFCHVDSIADWFFFFHDSCLVRLFSNPDGMNFTHDEISMQVEKAVSGQTCKMKVPTCK